MACLCEQIAGPDMEMSPVCVGHLWVFENLSPEDLEAVAGAALRKKYERGDRIFSQGDNAEEMFLIKAGRVRLSKLTEDGNEITLDIRKAGDVVGETILNEDMEYPVAATCIEETLSCGFTKKRFEDLVLQYPTIGLQVIRNLTRRIDQLTRRIGDMSFTDLETRLYRVLFHVAREHGVESSKGFEIQFPLTHEDLSFLVGAHRVSITRAMKTLKESGRLTQEGRVLIISGEAGSLS